MGLFTNVGGQLKELSSLTTTVGGELKEINSLTANIGGQPKEIFTRTIIIAGTWHKTSGVSNASTMTPSVDTVVASVTLTLPVKYTYYMKITDGYGYIDGNVSKIQNGTMLNIGLEDVPKFVVYNLTDNDNVRTSTGIIEGTGKITVNLHAGRYGRILNKQTGEQTYANYSDLSFDYSFTFERV